MNLGTYGRELTFVNLDDCSSAGHLEILADSWAYRDQAHPIQEGLERLFLQRAAENMCSGVLLPHQKCRAHCPNFFLPCRSVGPTCLGCCRRRLAGRILIPYLPYFSPLDFSLSFLPFPPPPLLLSSKPSISKKGRIKSDSGSSSELSLLHRHLNRCHLLDGNRFLLLPFFCGSDRGVKTSTPLCSHINNFDFTHIVKLFRQYRQDG
jgi:hypothetical protein